MHSHFRFLVGAKDITGALYFILVTMGNEQGISGNNTGYRALREHAYLAGRRTMRANLRTCLESFNGSGLKFFALLTEENNDESRISRIAL